MKELKDVLPEFENHLKVLSNKKYFIFPNTPYTHDDISKIASLANEYGLVTVMSLIEPKTDKKRKDFYFMYQIKCSRCGRIENTTQTKTKFIEVLQTEFNNQNSTNKQTHGNVCSDCSNAIKNELLQKRKEEQEEQEKLLTEQRENATEKFINVYLNPDFLWNAEFNKSKWFKHLQYKYTYAHKSKVIEHIKNMQYYDFLKTPYWKAIAQQKRYYAKYKCELCASSENIAVHHKTYDNHGNEIENLSDLIVLCSECHEKFHDIVN